MLGLLALLLLVLAAASVGASWCHDELAGARRTLLLVLAGSLILAAALLLYATVPLWAQLAVLLLLLLGVTVAERLFLLLAPLLLALAGAAPRALGLGGVAALLLGGEAYAALHARDGWRRSLASTAKGLPLLLIGVCAAGLFLWLGGGNS